MKPIETYDYKGYTIEIHTDEDPQNPREDYDNVSVFAFFNKRYRLGDKDHGIRDTDYSSFDEMEDAIRKKFDVAVITPVYMYEHSGITIASHPFSCPWDSGQIGFAWITKKSARETWLYKVITKERLKKLEAALESDIKVYDNFLSGEVYGYVIKDPDGNDVDDGSCWNWYGDDVKGEDSYAVKEAKSSIDHEIKRRENAAKPENNPAQMKLGMEGVS